METKHVYLVSKQDYLQPEQRGLILDAWFLRCAVLGFEETIEPLRELNPRYWQGWKGTYYLGCWKQSSIDQMRALVDENPDYRFYRLETDSNRRS